MTAGILLVRHRNSKAQTVQEARVVNDLPAVRIDNVTVKGGAAIFDVTNISNQTITAFAARSGRYKVVTEMSYPGSEPLGPGKTMTKKFLTLDGAQPLTVDALVYQSGEASGDPEVIQKIRDTRTGYKQGMRQIARAIIAEASVMGNG